MKEDESKIQSSEEEIKQTEQSGDNPESGSDSPDGNPSAGDTQPAGDSEPSANTDNQEPEEEEESNEPVTLTAEEYRNLVKEAGKAQENWENFLRGKAELDNFRKRSARDQDESRKRANEGLISDFLPILDNFEAALVAANQSSQMNLEALKTGVEMILGQMKNMLTDNGLKEVDAAGKEFDPSLHDALGEEESDEVKEGYVVKQLRKGYLLRDRLIRPASVYVAKKPGSKTNDDPEAQKPAEEASEA